MKKEEKARQIMQLIGNKLHAGITDESLEMFIRNVMFLDYYSPEYWIDGIAPLMKKWFPENKEMIDSILNS